MNDFLINNKLNVNFNDNYCLSEDLNGFIKLTYLFYLYKKFLTESNKPLFNLFNVYDEDLTRCELFKTAFTYRDEIRYYNPSFTTNFFMSIMDNQSPICTAKNSIYILRPGYNTDNIFYSRSTMYHKHTISDLLNKEPTELVKLLNKYNNEVHVLKSSNCIYVTSINVFIITLDSFIKLNKEQIETIMLCLLYPLRQIYTEDYIKTKLQEDPLLPVEQNYDKLVEFYNKLETEKIYRKIELKCQSILEKYTDEQNELLKKYNNLVEQSKIKQLKFTQLLKNVQNTTIENMYPDIVENIYFNFDSNDCVIKLIVYFKFFPITYIDDDLLENAIKNNNIYFANDNCKSAIQYYLEHKEEVYLGSYPCSVVVTWDPTTPDGRNYVNISEKTPKRPDNTRLITTETVLNGHAFYNGDSSMGCLGSFGPHIFEAIADLNINKLIALLVQYHQSIAPADYAGQRTIKNPLLIDWKNKKIIYDAYNRHTSANLQNITYTIQEGDDRIEYQSNV